MPPGSNGTLGLIGPRASRLLRRILLRHTFFGRCGGKGNRPGAGGRRRKRSEPPGYRRRLVSFSCSTPAPRSGRATGMDDGQRFAAVSDPQTFPPAGKGKELDAGFGWLTAATRPPSVDSGKVRLWLRSAAVQWSGVPRFPGKREGRSGVRSRSPPW